MGKLVKLLTFSLSCFFLIGCAPGDATERSIELEKDQITVHGRWAGSNEDASTKIINLNVGDSISGILKNPMEGYWSAPNRPIGVYLDAERTTKLKTSQLLNWDGSFHDLYVYSEVLGNIDINTYFSGTYYGNEEDRYLNISNGAFTMNFDGNVITGNIVLGDHDLEYLMTNVVFNGAPLSEFKDYEDYNYYVDGFEITDELGFSSTQYETRTINCSAIFLFFKLVDGHFQTFEEYMCNYFTQNNYFSIDYDLVD